MERQVTRFHEEQRFRQPWLWLLLAVVFIGVILAIASVGLSREGSIFIVLGAGVVPLIAVLLAFVQLVTDVSDDTLTIAYRGLWPTRRIALRDIARHEVVTYRGWLTGYGVRISFTYGMVYNSSGDRGVRIVLRDGSKLLVGSQRAEELNAALGVM